MYYKHGDLNIKKEKLIGFLEAQTTGRWNTHDLIEEYQGNKKINLGIPGGSSWNASFGKILAQCAGENPQTIKRADGKERVSIDDVETGAETWIIL